MPAGYALVLDHDAPLRALVRDALQAVDWHVRSAPPDRVAWHMAATCRPDVVLLDVSLSTHAPEALAAGLRIHYGPDLPILATATLPHPWTVQDIGAYAFLEKPFELTRLLRLLERGRNLSHHSARLRQDSNEVLGRLRLLREPRA